MLSPFLDIVSMVSVFRYILPNSFSQAIFSCISFCCRNIYSHILKCWEDNHIRLLRSYSFSPASAPLLPPFRPYSTPLSIPTDPLSQPIQVKNHGERFRCNMCSMCVSPSPDTPPFRSTSTLPLHPPQFLYCQFILV